MKKALFVLSAVFLFVGCTHQATTNTNTQASTVNAAANEQLPAANTNATQQPLTFSFQTPRKSPHYESNAPAHESILPAAPYTVVIDFNFDVAPGSTISIMHNGKEYGEGEVTIDDNKLALRRRVQPDAPNGLYSVTYSACWPDGSCHEGLFQFAIDSSLADTYIDKRGQSAIEIDMKNIAFAPMNIRVSAGTTITWKNSDAVTHYVNTDSHPAHTFFPEQNSSALENGDTYSTTFATRGAYPYHCSAHADTMTGMILVE